MTGNTGCGYGGTGSAQSLGATGGTGTGRGAPRPTPVPPDLDRLPHPRHPRRLGWAVTALLACMLLAYPLLLLARWQFSGRKEDMMLDEMAT